jgi:cysteine desulfurase/selenocysteine lyase
MHRVSAWEAQLLAYGSDRLAQIDGFRMIGTAACKAGVMAFVLGDIHANDVGTIVDLHGVAIRTGHHCAMPVAEFFGVPATARASLGVYNTFAEIDVLADALEKTIGMFS